MDNKDNRVKNHSGDVTNASFEDFTRTQKVFEDGGDDNDYIDQSQTSKQPVRLKQILNTERDDSNYDADVKILETQLDKEL